MTTALAFDLFLDEHEAILDIELLKHINEELNKAGVNNKNIFFKIGNQKMENDKWENGFSKIKNKKVSDLQNEISEKEIKNIEYYCDKNQKITFTKSNNLNTNKNLKKEMVKSYLKLLS